MSDVKTSKGYTAPKGRPTVHATDVVERKRVSPVMEWVIAGIVLAAIVAAIFYFGAGLRVPVGGHGGGHGGAAPVELVDIASDVV